MENKHKLDKKVIEKALRIKNPELSDEEINEVVKEYINQITKELEGFNNTIKKINKKI
jgi:DNA-binding transcriptional regulator WhiA